MANVEWRIAHFSGIVVCVSRGRASSQVVLEIGEAVAVGVIDGVSESLRHALAQRQIQSVVIGVSVVGRQFEEAMLTIESAIGIYLERVDRRYRIQVRIWELHDGTSVIGSRNQPLIGIPEPVHLSAPVAHVSCRKHSVLEDLVLRTKACLL